MVTPGAILVDSVSKRFELSGSHRADDLRELLSRPFRRALAVAIPKDGDGEAGANGSASGPVYEDGAFWALRDVSFRVEPGEIFGIVGHNGSGKSTMLKLLTGILQPTHGTVKVGGRIGALIEVGAGFHPDLTGRENIFLNGSIMGLSQREIARLFDRIVAFSELERFIDTPVKRYSSGMYTRLGFAIVAHISPDVLLVDEVLAVGDMAFQAKCMNRLREMNANGTTIAFVSHDMGAVAKLCRAAVLLNRGRVVAEGPTQVVIDAHQRDMMAHMEAQFRKEEAADAADAERAAGAEGPAAPSPARITSVELLDARGEPARLCRTGDTVAVRVEYEADRDLGDCEVGIGVTRVDGVNCYGPNTTTDAEPVRIGAGAGAFEVTFPALPLLADTYTLAAALLEGGRLLDYKDGQCRFVVEDPRGERGVARMEHVWRHRPRETAVAVPAAAATAAPATPD